MAVNSEFEHALEEHLMQTRCAKEKALLSQDFTKAALYKEQETWLSERLHSLRKAQTGVVEDEGWTPTLTARIRELEAMVRHLEARIAELERHIADH